jgi:hypothetical protein
MPRPTRFEGLLGHGLEEGLQPRLELAHGVGRRGAIHVGGGGGGGGGGVGHLVCSTAQQAEHSAAGNTRFGDLSIQTCAGQAHQGRLRERGAPPA